MNALCIEEKVNYLEKVGSNRSRLVTLEAVLNLLDVPISDSGDSKLRFREFLKNEVNEVEEYDEFLRECLEKGGRGGRQFNNALQDIIISIGEKIGFDVEYGLYSGTRDETEIGYDGLWKKESGEHILIEVKSSPWPVNSITAQLGQYIEKYSDLQHLHLDQVFGLYVLGPGDLTAIVDQIRGSQFRNRIRLISFTDLLKLLKLTKELDTIGGLGSGAQKVQSILLPFDSVNVGDFIDIIMEIAELRTTTATDVGIENEEILERVWERDTLHTYLNNGTGLQRAFLTVLAHANEEEEPLPMQLILQRMERAAANIQGIPEDQTFTGFTIAGLRAGFKMRRDRYNAEDIIDAGNKKYKLKPEYKNLVKQWVVQQGYSIPSLQE